MVILNACGVDINTWNRDKRLLLYFTQSAWTQLAHLFHCSLSYLSLSRSVESLLRMKEETAEVDEFTFSQGTSDQESNGSGSYYIKQEPWGHEVRTEQDEPGWNMPLENPSKDQECGYWNQPWTTLRPIPRAFFGVSTGDGDEKYKGDRLQSSEKSWREQFSNPCSCVCT